MHVSPLERHVFLDGAQALEHFKEIHLFGVAIRVADVVEGDVVLCAEASDGACEQTLRECLCDGAAD